MANLNRVGWRIGGRCGRYHPDRTVPSPLSSTPVGCRHSRWPPSPSWSTSGPGVCSARWPRSTRSSWACRRWPCPPWSQPPSWSARWGVSHSGRSPTATAAAWSSASPRWRRSPPCCCWRPQAATRRFAGGLLLGIGGATFAVGIPFVNAWFPPHRRGLALGIYGMGKVGTAVANFASPRIAQAAGRPWVYLLVAVVLAVVGLAFLLLARDSPTRPTVSEPLPARFGAALRLPASRDLAALYAVTSHSPHSSSPRCASPPPTAPPDTSARSSESSTPLTRVRLIREIIASRGAAGGRADVGGIPAAIADVAGSHKPLTTRRPRPGSSNSTSWLHCSIWVAPRNSKRGAVTSPSSRR
ncbi:MAG: MFS transporter [Pseudonocardiaceae bacterium]|nr:MFS transporter [Pseudonocardiaceae bacterium]